MPIPLAPGGDGAAPAPGSASAAPATPATSVTAATQAAPQQVQGESVVRPALATALPSWDLMPPHQVLTFRRRA
jgi:hypothetical protein